MNNDGQSPVPGATVAIGNLRALDLSFLTSAKPVTSASPVDVARRSAPLTKSALSYTSYAQAIRRQPYHIASKHENRPPPPLVLKQGFKLKPGSKFPFEGEYLVTEERKPPPRDVEDDLAQFKCTWEGCYKRISTNINFMHHIWAHLAHEKDIATDSDTTVELQYMEKTVADLLKIRGRVKSQNYCVYCVSTFTSLKETIEHCQLHNPRGVAVQKDKSLCHICERAVHSAERKLHLDIHGPTDLPYSCEFCRFKTSSRMALIRHFEKKHNNGVMLLCPFCTDVFVAKRQYSKGRRVFITADNFIKHVKSHVDFSMYRAKCKRCACKFSSDDHGCLEKRMNEHKSFHLCMKNKIEDRDLAALDLEMKSKRSAKLNVMPSQCPDCNCYFKTVESHFAKDVKKCENAGCQYSTACPVGLRQHKVLCSVGPEIPKRVPYGRRTLTTEPKVSVKSEKLALNCSHNCGFKCHTSHQMANHLNRQCVGATGVLDSATVPTGSQEDGLSCKQEDEVEKFALKSSRIVNQKRPLPKFVEDPELNESMVLAFGTKNMKELRRKFRGLKRMKLRHNYYMDTEVGSLLAIHKTKVNLSQIANKIIPC